MIGNKQKRPELRQSIRVKITRPVSSPHTGSAARLSENFFRLLLQLLTTIFLTAVVLALFFHWRISDERVVFTQLAEQGTTLQKEHTTLLMSRNELMSKSRIAAAAAVRLGLQFPETEQVHRLY